MVAIVDVLRELNVNHSPILNKYFQVRWLQWSLCLSFVVCVLPSLGDFYSYCLNIIMISRSTTYFRIGDDVNVLNDFVIALTVDKVLKRKENSFKTHKKL